MDWKYLITNPNGTPSVTKIAFVSGLALISLKFALSGLHFGNFAFPEFNSSEYAIAVGALAATYIFRAKEAPKKDE